MDDTRGEHINNRSSEQYFHDLLTDHCRWRAISPSNILDRRVASVQKSPGGELDFMLYQAPFRTLVGHPAVQLAFIAFGIYQLFLVFEVIFGIESYGVKKVGEIKFIGADSDSQHLNLSMVRFLYRGCEFLAEDMSNITAATLRLPRPVQIDGLVLNLSGANNNTGLVTFKLLGTNDGWRTSTVIGSSDLRLAKTDVRFLDTLVPFRPQYAFDYQPRLPFLAYTLGHYLVWSTICVGVGVCGLLNRSALGKAVCIWALGAAGIVACLSSVGLLVIQQEREAFTPLVNTLTYAALAAILLTTETRIINAYLAFGLANFAFRVVNNCAVFRDCGYLLVEPPLVSLVFIAASSTLIATRRRSFLRAMEGVEGDRATYDALWRVAAAADSAIVDELEVFVRKVAAGCGAPPGPLRQLNRQTRRAEQSVSFVSRVFQASGGDGLEGDGLGEHHSVPGRFDPTRPVRSLDQLYAQASAAVYFLHTHCAEWAALCQGILDSSALCPGPPGVGAPPPPAPLDDVSETVARWAEARLIKRPARAVEKLLACYGGDASRLLDVCRARILFTGIADVLRCAKAVQAAAPLVRIVGTKNSLRTGHDSRLTGGYRCVVLYIHFDNQDARYLGVEGLICELQLALKSFVDIQDAASQSRYHNFRAKRTLASIAQSPSSHTCWSLMSATNKVFSEAAAAGLLVEVKSSELCPSHCNDEAELCVQGQQETDVRRPRPESDSCLERNVDLKGASRYCSLEFWLSNLGIGIEIFQRSTLLSDGLIDEEVANVFKAVNFSSSSSVLFTR